MGTGYRWEAGGGRQRHAMVWPLLGGARSSYQTPESHVQQPESTSAHLLCLVHKPLRSLCPRTWHGGRISVGLSCPPCEPVLVPTGGFFSPCLKNCMLLPCSGILPGCCTVDGGEVSGGEACCDGVSYLPDSTCTGHQPPACTICLPRLPSWDGAGVLPGTWWGEGDAVTLPSHSCRRVGAGVRPAVCGKIYSWLLALASSSPSWCQHQCLLDIYSHLCFLGSVFLFGTCWEEQGLHPVCAEQRCAGRRFVPVEVMELFWQISPCSNMKGKR